MCGIAGYMGSRFIPPDAIEACLRQMEHRGPDNRAHRHWNTETGGTVHLLHTRLNIIDLDHRADPPLRSGSKWIAFNGELYNYRELRKSMVDEGTVFKTQSDTEVLINAIDTRGWGVLDDCDGMWAFAVYDENEESLTLCRDRFGEKPLYLHQTGDGLYFGSEIKFIFTLLGRKTEADLDQLRRFLVNGYKSLNKQPGSFYRGIRELPGASLLRVDRKGVQREERYWSFRHQPDETLTFGTAVEKTRELLIRSVERRLRSDVPIAFCMSGGVDSNALISIAKKIHGYDVHGFTIIDADPRYDESEMVGLAVKELGLRHTPIPVETKNFLPRLSTLVRRHDAPVHTINYYAHWRLMKSIAENGYRISVSGTGADELFSGYYDHHLFYLHALRNDARALDQARQNWETHIKPIVRNPLLRNPDAFLENPENRDHLFMDAASFGDFLTGEWNDPFTEAHFTESLLRNRMLNELFFEAVPPILHEDDHNAMHFSIENRSPYLDRELFEFSLTIPDPLLIRDGRAKAVLREAVRGIAPDGIIENRRKIGFNASIFSYLDLEDENTRAFLLDDGPIFEHVKRDRIETLIAKPALPNSESKFLFYFISSKLFLEECT